MAPRNVPPPVAVPNEDFDFEQQNAKFKKDDVAKVRHCRVEVCENVYKESFFWLKSSFQSQLLCIILGFVHSEHIFLTAKYLVVFAELYLVQIKRSKLPLETSGILCFQSVLGSNLKDLGSGSNLQIVLG